MIRCNHCGTNNLDGSEYCDECGTKLEVSAPSPRQTYAPPSQFITQVAPPPPPSFTKDAVTPKPATPYTPPPPPVHPLSGHPAPGHPLPGHPLVTRAADQAVDQAPERTVDRSVNQASNFPPPPGVSEAAGNKSQSSVQSPNQTTAFNGQTTALRGGASDAES